MIPIAKPIIGEEERKAVLEVLNSGIIAQGPKVKEFEENFKNYIGVSYAVATNSGTSALQIALKACNLKKGDEVITTPFSFVATANAILFTGAKPVFVDVEENTFNIDPELINDKINKNTKAILPVHLYGLAADMDKIMGIAQENHLNIIEDAAQAHGAAIGNKLVGSFGDASCFSFYPTKNMTTSEGGMITTNNQEIYEKSLMLRDHGSRKKYYHEVLGYNFRMTDIGAAIGIQQLKKLDKFNEDRIMNAEYLSKRLSGIKGIILPKIHPKFKHVFHQYTIRVNNRDEVIKKLEANKIGYGIHYPLPINNQKLYLDMGYKNDCPVAEKLCEEVISLPVHPSLTKEDLDKIVEVFL